MKIAIIGGGAAGFFAAISAKENYPKAEVVLLEKSNKVLSKVKISGGGRCNVTNSCKTTKELLEGYPRGKKKLKKAFKTFNNQHAQEWFESRGVPLKTEIDGRVFPVSDNSKSVVDCLFNEMNRLNVSIKMRNDVQTITSINHQLKLTLKDDGISKTVIYDKVIVASGGSPKASGLEWLKNLGHKIESPVPSLFTFNMPAESITKLMGVVAPHAQVSIQGNKLKSSGPLLITHWGMSGPAILKLSAHGARLLHDFNYTFKLQVNWISIQNNELVLNKLLDTQAENSRKNLSNVRPYALPDRLWNYFLNKLNISPDKKWGELGIKSLHKLVNILTHDIYATKGKTTFKEEFVTCGGVSLDSIDMNTMQSTVCKNLYFAGEVLDIDGITGGYNFQAAWTTAFIAGKLS